MRLTGKCSGKNCQVVVLVNVLSYSPTSRRPIQVNRSLNTAIHEKVHMLRDVAEILQTCWNYVMSNPSATQSQTERRQPVHAYPARESNQPLEIHPNVGSQHGATTQTWYSVCRKQTGPIPS